jgi:hypothetical protein
LGKQNYKGMAVSNPVRGTSLALLQGFSLTERSWGGSGVQQCPLSKSLFVAE